MESYTDALCKELAAKGETLSTLGKASTIYIGGGTPTALPVPLLARVIQTAQAVIPTTDNLEFTVEANPGTVTLETMTMLSTLGVNRVSIGAQVFDDAILKRIGRIHTSQDIRDAVRWARAALIVDVSVDLMYGLPGQTMDDLVADLKLTHELPLAMNSTTIFVPAENTEYANEPAGNPVLTLNMMALLRIMNPHRLMPTTSSLEKMMHDGQYLGLMAGANTVTIHDGTPEEFHKFFPIYSAKRVRPQLDHFKEIVKRAGMTARFEIQP